MNQLDQEIHETREPADLVHSVESVQELAVKEAILQMLQPYG